MNTLEPFEVSPDMLNRVLNLGVKKTYKRGHLFMDGPSSSNLLLFVQKGAMRSYFSHAEYDLTYWINVENEFSCTLNFFTGDSGQTFLEAIEPLEVVEIKRDQLQQAYLVDPTIDQFGRLLAESQLRVLQRNYQMICEKSAAKRYNLFLDAYPHLNGRVHLKYIASLLKMDQATLSRVRGKNNGLKTNLTVEESPTSDSTALAVGFRKKHSV